MSIYEDLPNRIEDMNDSEFQEFWNRIQEDKEAGAEA